MQGQRRTFNEGVYPHRTPRRGRNRWGGGVIAVSCRKQLPRSRASGSRIPARLDDVSGWVSESKGASVCVGQWIVPRPERATEGHEGAAAILWDAEQVRLYVSHANVRDCSRRSLRRRGVSGYVNASRSARRPIWMEHGTGRSRRNEHQLFGLRNVPVGVYRWKHRVEVANDGNLGGCRTRKGHEGPCRTGQHMEKNQ